MANALICPTETLECTIICDVNVNEKQLGRVLLKFIYLFILNIYVILKESTDHKRTDNSAKLVVCCGGGVMKCKILPVTHLNS